MALENLLPGAASQVIDRVVNPSEALSRTGGDVALMKELAGLCCDECPRILAEIRDAISVRDGRKLQITAHALKGSVGIFAAETAVAAAWRLEQIGRDAIWPEANEAFAELVEAIDRLRPALSEICG
jgi:HPt (histidine-containing phosphotransfer) domain-containing protein